MVTAIVLQWPAVSKEYEEVWNFPAIRVPLMANTYVVIQAPINAGSKFFNVQINTHTVVLPTM